MKPVTTRQLAAEIYKMNPTGRKASTLQKLYKKHELEILWEKFYNAKRVAKTKKTLLGQGRELEPNGTDYVDIKHDAKYYKDKLEETSKRNIALRKLLASQNALISELQDKDYRLANHINKLEGIIRDNSAIAKIKRFFGITK